MPQDAWPLAAKVEFQECGDQLSEAGGQPLVAEASMGTGGGAA